jgi:HEAT repeat protein
MCIDSGKTVTAAVLLVLLGAVAVPAQQSNRFRSMSPDKLLDAWRSSARNERVLIVEAMLEQRLASTATLRAAARSGDVETRRLACTLLGELRDDGAVGALLAATSDPDRGVRARAVSALRQIGDASAVPRLRELVRGASDRAVLKRAVVALGTLGDASDVSALRPLLAHADLSVRVVAAGALAMLDNGEGEDILLAAVDAGDPIAQRNATFALGYLDTPDAQARLEAILADPNGRWRSEALMALTQRQRRQLGAAGQVAVLMQLASGRDRQAAMWAVEELSDLATPAASQALASIGARRGMRADSARVRARVAEGR